MFYLVVTSVKGFFQGSCIKLFDFFRSGINKSTYRFVIFVLLASHLFIITIGLYKFSF